MPAPTTWSAPASGGTDPDTWAGTGTYVSKAGNYWFALTRSTATNTVKLRVSSSAGGDWTFASLPAAPSGYTSNQTASWYSGVHYGGSNYAFVIGYSNGTTYKYRIIHTTNPTGSWSAYAFDNTDTYQPSLGGLIYANNLWVLVGRYLTASPQPGFIATSSAVTGPYTFNTSAATTGYDTATLSGTGTRYFDIRTIAFNGTRWVTGADTNSGPAYVRTSTTLTSGWAAPTTAPSINSCSQLRYHSNNYWTFIEGNGALWFTADPTTSWTEITNTTVGAENVLGNIAYGDGYWLVACSYLTAPLDDAVRISYLESNGSPNGTYSFADATGFFDSQAVDTYGQDIVYADGYFLASATYDGELRYCQVTGPPAVSRALDADDVPIGTVGEGLFVTSHNPAAPGTGTGTVALWQISDTDPDPVWVNEALVATNPYYGVVSHNQNDGVSVEDRSFGWIDQTPGAHMMSQYNGIVATSSGVVTVGRYQQSTLQYAQVVKRSLSGSVQWTITATGMTSSMEAVCELVSGDLLVTGHTNNSNGTLTLGGQSVAITTSSPFVAKISSAGTVLWLIANQTSGSGGTSVFAGLAPTADGGAVVTGQLLKAMTFAPLGSFAQAMCFAAKITSAGVWTWVAISSGTLLTNGQYHQKCVNDGSGGVWISAAQSSGSVTLGGTTLSSPNGSTYTYTARVSSSGTWTTAFLNHGSDYSSSSSDITKVGSDCYSAVTLNPVGAGQTFVAVRRLSGSTVIWERAVGGGASTGGASAPDIAPLSDGTGVVVIGDKYQGNLIVGDTTLGDGSTGDSMFAATLTVNGTWTGAWWSTLDIAEGGVSCQSGDIYIAGGFYSPGTWGSTSLTPNGTQDYWPGAAWVGKLDASVTTAHQNTIVAFTDKNGLGGGCNLIVITYDGTFNVAVHDFPLNGTTYPNWFLLVSQDGEQFCLVNYGIPNSNDARRAKGFTMTGTQVWALPFSALNEAPCAFPVANKIVRQKYAQHQVFSFPEKYANHGYNSYYEVVDCPTNTVYTDQISHMYHRNLVIPSGPDAGEYYWYAWQASEDYYNMIVQGSGPAGFMVTYIVPGPPTDLTDVAGEPPTIYYFHATLSGNTLTASPLNSFVAASWWRKLTPFGDYYQATWQGQSVMFQVGHINEDVELGNKSLYYVNSQLEYGISETFTPVYDTNSVKILAAGLQHTINFEPSVNTWDFWYAHQPFILEPLPEPAVPVWHKYWASDDA
jgi:hypothetical protein